jgi:hypothetical protein
MVIYARAFLGENIRVSCAENWAHHWGCQRQTIVEGIGSRAAEDRARQHRTPMINYWHHRAAAHVGDIRGSCSVQRCPRPMQRSGRRRWPAREGGDEGMRPLAKLPGLSVWLSVMSQSESAVRSRLGARTSGMILLLLIDRAFFLRTENMIAPAGVLSSSY